VHFGVQISPQFHEPRIFNVLPLNITMRAGCNAKQYYENR